METITPLSYTETTSWSSIDTELLTQEETSCIFTGKFVRNTNLQKLCVSFKMSGRLTEVTQCDLTDGICQGDEWEKKRSISKYLIVVLAKSCL